MRYISDLIRDNSRNKESVVQNQTYTATLEKPERLNFTVEIFYRNKAGEIMPINTAAELDEFAIEVMKQLRPKSNAVLANAIEQVIKTTKIMFRWGKSKINHIYKVKGDKDKVNFYKSVTVTSAIYRPAERTKISKAENKPL